MALGRQAAWRPGASLDDQFNLNIQCVKLDLRTMLEDHLPLSPESRHVANSLHFVLCRNGSCRQGTSCKLAKRLGIPVEWVKIPFVPACMAAAGPTEWLKIFKTFCSFSGLPFLRCRRVMFRWAGIVLALVSTVDASEFWVVSVGEQVFLGDIRTFSIETNPLLVLPLSWACEQWLAVLEADSTKTTLSVTNYLKKCLTSGVAKGYIKYTSWDGNTRQTLPQVITLAGVLSAVVLNDSVLSPEGATLLRAIATEWKDWCELSAAQHIFENYASQTTGMSKTDPG